VSNAGKKKKTRMQQKKLLHQLKQLKTHQGKRRTIEDLEDDKPPLFRGNISL